MNDSTPNLPDPTHPAETGVPVIPQPPAVEPAKKNKWTLWIVLIVVLLLLCLCCAVIGTVLFLFPAWNISDPFSDFRYFAPPVYWGG